MSRRIEQLKQRLLEAEDEFTRLLEDPAADVSEQIAAEFRLEVAEEKLREELEIPGDWF